MCPCALPDVPKHREPILIYTLHVRASLAFKSPTATHMATRVFLYSIEQPGRHTNRVDMLLTVVHFGMLLDRASELSMAL